MSKSDKLDRAIAESRGEVVQTPKPSLAESMAALHDLSAEIVDFDPADVERLRADGYVSLSEIFGKLKPGQGVAGFLVGREETQVKKPGGNGEMNIVSKFTLELASGRLMSMLGTVQLERSLRRIPADGSHHVVIGKGEARELPGGRRMYDFDVHGKRARPPTVIATTASAPQLPSGNA
jgi:hypothetical protein